MAAGARENSDFARVHLGGCMVLDPPPGRRCYAGYVLLAVRNQATNLGMPSSIGTRGLYPSFWRALSMFANVIGTSPGCSGCRWTMAFLLSAFSSSSIKYESFTVCDSPRLKIS